MTDPSLEQDRRELSRSWMARANQAEAEVDDLREALRECYRCATLHGYAGKTYAASPAEAVARVARAAVGTEW